MRTADLISALAEDAGKVRRSAVTRRFAPSVALGLAAAGILLVVWLGVRPLGAAIGTHSFWMKAGYTLILSAGGLVLTAAAARPGARVPRCDLCHRRRDRRDGDDGRPTGAAHARRPAQRGPSGRCGCFDVRAVVE